MTTPKSSRTPCIPSSIQTLSVITREDVMRLVRFRGTRLVNKKNLSLNELRSQNLRQPRKFITCCQILLWNRELGLEKAALGNRLEDDGENQPTLRLNLRGGRSLALFFKDLLGMSVPFNIFSSECWRTIILQKMQLSLLRSKPFKKELK